MFKPQTATGAHHVVSVSSNAGCALMALAQPSGPSFTSTSRQDVVDPSVRGTTGGGGVYFAGGRPTAPGCFGPLTTCKPGFQRSAGKPQACLQQADKAVTLTAGP